MKRATSILTIAGAVFLAAATLQPHPFSFAGGDDSAVTANHRASQQTTPEMVEKWLEVAEEVDPAKARELRAMCHQNPDEFHRVMRQSGRSIVALSQLKDQDPELYQRKLGELRLEAQVESASVALADAIRAGREEDIPALEETLRRWLRMQVLHSIRARGDYLLRLKQHVQRLEEELAYEAENFEQTVDQRFEEIVARSRDVVSTDVR